jgi:outer membrane protein OmpA-like peptidoglycan-associated protein
MRVAPLFAILLSGCSSMPASLNPVSWWHDLQGGKIAEERPPPPGADQPYPNLASVPAKPAQPDRAALTNIANALIADRTNAQHIAAAAPIADPSSPSASPGLFGRGTAQPPPPPAPSGTQTASATLPAAEAPPPAPTPPAAKSPDVTPPPAKAPVGDVQSAPLAPPGATAQPPAIEAAAPPPLPTTPPPPPSLPGVSAPPPASAGQPAAATPTAVAAATPPPPPGSNPADTVNVTFVSGSATLPAVGADTLKQLAARRGNGVIAVTGYGDATSDDPTAQSQALGLGLSRAQAMASALTAAGVPASAVQVDAAALGRGGMARLVR